MPQLCEIIDYMFYTQYRLLCTAVLDKCTHHRGLVPVHITVDWYLYTSLWTGNCTLQIKLMFVFYVIMDIIIHRWFRCTFFVEVITLFSLALCEVVPVEESC